MPDSHCPTKTLSVHGDMEKRRLFHVPAYFRDTHWPGDENNVWLPSWFSCFKLLLLIFMEHSLS